ncbi:sulfurtransferase TusA family protein [Fundidesulfovibrio butyratiphilus]
MSDSLDVRGLSCPQPVMETLTKLKAMGSGELEILADGQACRENVTRAAQSQGWSVDVQGAGDGEYRLTLKKE